MFIGSETFPRPGVLGLPHHRLKTKTWVQETYLKCDSKKQEKARQMSQQRKISPLLDTWEGYRIKCIWIQVASLKCRQSSYPQSSWPPLVEGCHRSVKSPLTMIDHPGGSTHGIGEKPGTESRKTWGSLLRWGTGYPWWGSFCPELSTADDTGIRTVPTRCHASTRGTCTDLKVEQGISSVRLSCGGQ